MDLEIVPFNSIGPIELGMEPDEIHQLFNCKFDGFQSFDEFWEISYDLGLQICYGDVQPFVCRAVMMEEPANPLFEGRRLLDGSSIEELGNWLKSMDVNLSISTEGVSSNKLGIHLSTQDYSLFRQEPPETVLVFGEEYFNSLSL